MIDCRALTQRLKASLHALLDDPKYPNVVYVAQAFGGDMEDMTFLGVFTCKDVARSCAKRAVQQVQELRGADILVLPVSIIEQPWAYNPRFYVD